MPNSTNPSIDIGDIRNFAQAYKDMATQFGAQNGLVLNPTTGEYVSNPNFVPATGAATAQQQNIQLQDSIVPTADLMNYRDQAGNTPTFGMTYGQLTANGFNPVSPAQQGAVVQGNQAATAVQNAEQLGTSIANDTSNPVLGFLRGLISKVTGPLGLDPQAQAYQQAVQQVPGQYQGALPTVGQIGTNPGGTQSAFNSILQQVGLGRAGVTQTQPIPQVQVPQSPNTNPYTSTAPGPVNPGSYGQTAFETMKAGQ